MLPCTEEWDFPLPIPQRTPLSSWAGKARKVKVSAHEVISLNGALFFPSTPHSPPTHTESPAHTHTEKREEEFPVQPDGRTRAGTRGDTTGWCIPLPPSPRASATPALPSHTDGRAAATRDTGTNVFLFLAPRRHLGRSWHKPSGSRPAHRGFFPPLSAKAI